MHRDERGSAVVDFVLVMMLLIPLVLGILQVALTLHVRNTLTAAASEGARASARLDATAADGSARARDMIRTTLADRFADDISVSYSTIEGVPAVSVVARASVPVLGLFGPSVDLTVRGHAIRELEP